MPKCHGRVLHDSHAEVLALRGLNYWLLTEVTRMLQDRKGYQSQWLYSKGCCWKSLRSEPDKDSWPPFHLRPNVSIHLLSTEHPCGDASMECLMSELGPEASRPWQIPVLVADESPTSSKAGVEAASTSLYGRAYFSSLGLVRRKPSRPDAEPTLSKSCTDKLTVKQLTGLLSFPSCCFIANSSNVYLSSFVLPSSQYSSHAYERAFRLSGRLSRLCRLELPPSHSYHPFPFCPLPFDFPSFSFSKAAQMSSTNRKGKPSSVSALYIYQPQDGGSDNPKPVVEALINGVKQGYSAISPTDDIRKASRISRSSFFRLAKLVAQGLLQEVCTTHQDRQRGDHNDLDLSANSTNYEEIIVENDKKDKQSDRSAFLIGGQQEKAEHTNTSHDHDNQESSSSSSNSSNNNMSAPLNAFLNAETYDDAKRIAEQSWTNVRQRAESKRLLVNHVLPGTWPKNVGDGEWGV